MKYWMVKSEPETYSFSDLVRDGKTRWDLVRNPTARIHLRNFEKGDHVFIYHSMSDKAIVGICECIATAYPDPADDKWVAVDLAPVAALQNPVTLAAVKAHPVLQKMELVRQSRLSVCPVTDAEWAIVVALGGVKETKPAPPKSRR
jgi:predicted RNA-binding protein with PUA-like domain